MKSGTMLFENVLNDGIGKIECDSHFGSDLMVANRARASFKKKVKVFTAREERLIRFLAGAHPRHWTPFAHPQIGLTLKAPISVQRQWEKHKVGVVNSSESTRYVDVEEEVYVPYEFRQQSADKKQGSAGLMESGSQAAFAGQFVIQHGLAFRLYKAAIQRGMTGEQARDLLPLATYTTWQSTVSLYAAINIIEQRTGEGAQWEIAQYAHALKSIVQQLFPVTYDAFFGEKK